jgi:3-hydroxy-9,10-secoandrosta-1,3,5(10)-triene-9,17-dione monooxygenase
MDGSAGNLDTALSLVERAKRLVPALRARTPLAAELRRIPDETMADLHANGLFKAVRPARFGGLELDPVNLYRLQLELGRGCGSTAWVFGVLSVHTWQLALFPLEAQEEVWGTSPDTLISSSYMPVGKVERVSGGVRLSGRWSFSSGCDHSDWVMLGGFVPAEKEGAQPEMRTFLLPRADYTIIDTWYVSGLVASGSKDIVVENAFVPEHRMHKFADGYRQDSPGNAINTSPVYRYPFGQIHVRSVSTPAVGVALGAIEAMRELAANGRFDAEEDLRMREAMAEGAACLDREIITLERNFAEMAEHIANKTPIPVERRARFRNDSARAVSEAVAVVDALFEAAGMPALQTGTAINRAFQDVHAIRGHHANGKDGPLRNFGGVLLGRKSTDYFI